MIKSKLPDVGTTIFTIMSQLANEHNAINLGQGFPDFNPDEKLVSLVNEAMKNGHNQYPYMPGVQELRFVIADKINQLYSHDYNPDTEITVTNGATEALMSSILSIIHSGDEVIVIEPCYDSYVPCIKLAGGIPVFVSLTPPSKEKPAYSIDWTKVKNAITDKTRLIILNFPHNPTGLTLKESDLDAIENLIKDKEIFLIGDEVYEHIVFDNKPFLSLSTREFLASRSFVISSFGKTYHTTGWKVGYCSAPKAMMAEFRKIHQFVVFTVSSPMQYAFAEFMKDPSTYSNLSNFYQEKHDFLYDGLLNTRFKPIKSEGTFFMLADYSEISSANEFDFATELTKKHGVTLIPVSAFYKNSSALASNNHLVRFCFAKKNETLKKALDVLSTI
ncbi:methionine aminotransferase [Advenella sp. RU8]|uniref:methionine aminotransferase n=1 Tax=Advenella sp. RU8 TaxID=3399575 RepID=UPI003AAB2485